MYPFLLLRMIALPIVIVLSELSRGIILSTIICIFTIPVVMLVL